MNDHGRSDVLFGKFSKKLQEESVDHNSTSFTTIRLNKTTFLTIEDDEYGEQPYIYVKVYHDLLLICDTGCNSPRVKNVGISSLRQYLETIPVPSNHDKPLNPEGKRPYLILCSHAHYDHILGITQFLSSKPAIVASDYDKSFILEDLPTSSLCKYLGIPTPGYQITNWAADLSFLSHPETKEPLRIRLFHIPGHTPDSLAWYDIDEHHLYIGDTFYQRQREPEQLLSIQKSVEDVKSKNHPASTSILNNPMDIIFPERGDLIVYMSSLTTLLSFIQHQNTLLSRPFQTQLQSQTSTSEILRVNLGAGHITASADAEQITIEVQDLFREIIDDGIKAIRSFEKWGVTYDCWRSGNEKYGVTAPRNIVLDARKHFGGRPWL